MNNKNSIIKFEHVSIKKHLSEFIYKDINLELSPNKMICIKLDTSNDIYHLGNMLSGINPPYHGKILFNGQELSSLKPELREAKQYYIKRVFENRGFISNLNIIKNIMLSELHHTKRTEEEILKEIIKLAKVFDIENILNLRPFRCSKLHLKVAQWVRALSGTGKLIILEDPFTKNTIKNQLLFNILNEKIKSGISVIWIIHSMYQYKLLETNNIEIIDINQYLSKLSP